MQMTRTIVVALLAAVLSGCSATPSTMENFKPQNGYVPDAATAIKIAIAIWEPIYGVEQIAGEKPYQAHLAHGIWTVEGSLPAESVGGVTLAEIVQDDGKILRVIHGQ